MPKSCCVFKCTNNKTKNPNLSFYLLPNEATEPERRRSWLIAINRKNKDNKLWEPKSVYTYICSEHFTSGLKNDDPDHPDYTPSVFKYKKEGDCTKKTILTRFERSKKRKSDHLVDEDLSFSVLESPTSATVFKALPETALPSTSDEYVLDNIQLRKERDLAVKEMQEWKSKYDQIKLCAASIKENDKMCKKLTGLKWRVFNEVYLYLVQFMTPPTKRSLPLIDQLLITIIRLKTNTSFDFLSIITCTPKTTLIDYFWKWLDGISINLSFMIRPSDRNYIFQTIPPVFRAKFPQLTCIIDCFEIFIETPTNLKAHAQCWSSYKNHCTVKFFISCGPLGNVNYLSKAYGGRASDVQIVRESDFINLDFHKPGDQILADRGFTLHDDFAINCRADLITPAFTKGKLQLSAQEVETSRKISSVRIHIERVIGHIKNKYTISSGTLPIRLIKGFKDESENVNYSKIDKIVTACSVLINLGPSIVYND